MDSQQKIKELRESTGMNRKEFCEYFRIPYRTVTDWELGSRHAPDYVLRLMEYYIRMEGLMKKNTDEAWTDRQAAESCKCDAEDIRQVREDSGNI